MQITQLTMLNLVLQPRQCGFHLWSLKPVYSAASVMELISTRKTLKVAVIKTEKIIGILNLMTLMDIYM